MRISDWSSDVCSSDLYGNTATSCAWLGGEDVLSVDYGELRNSVSWAQLGNETFAGYAGEDLRSIIQAQFGHALHGIGELRNGGTITTARADEGRLHVFVPIRVYDVPVLGDVRSEEHTSELQSLMRTSYPVFCL